MIFSQMNLFNFEGLYEAFRKKGDYVLYGNVTVITASGAGDTPGKVLVEPQEVWEIHCKCNIN